MTIEIRQEQQGEVRVLALSGRLDTETAADLELALQDLQAEGATHFVIDLADIGYVSSAGLRVLLALAKQLDGGRGSLKLCALNEAVRQVFDVAGFSRMFAIFPNRDAALASSPAAAVPAPPRAPAAAPKPVVSAPPAPAPPPVKPVAAPAAPAPVARAPSPPPPPAPVAKAPVAEPSESDLARRAAELLGAGKPSPEAAPGSAELARAAAALLGAGAKAAPKNAAKSKSAEERPAEPQAPLPADARGAPEPAPSGVLGKFRNLFGGKK